MTKTLEENQFIFAQLNFSNYELELDSLRYTELHESPCHLSRCWICLVPRLDRLWHSAMQAIGHVSDDVNSWHKQTIWTQTSTPKLFSLFSGPIRAFMVRIITAHC